MFEIFFTLLISISLADTVTVEHVNYVEPQANTPPPLIYSLVDSWRLPGQVPNTALLKRHVPRTILLHHTGMPKKAGTIATKLQKLYTYSIRQDGDKVPWGDVPYHFYIDMNGNMMAGRPVHFAPDTKTDFDPTGYINITIEGNYTIAGGDKFSEAQKTTLTRLVNELKEKYEITSVMRHSDVAETKCPGHIRL